jgi:hypothetical protein
MKRYTVKIKKTTDSSSPPPEEGLFGRVLHDPEYFTPPLSRPEANNAAATVMGLPETVKCDSHKAFTEAYQWLSYNLLAKSMYGSPAEDIKSMFRTVYRGNAFKTNQKGWNNGYASYPTGDNIEAPPMKTEVIFTGGAYVKVLDNGAIKNHVGTPCYRIATLDTHQPPPSVDEWDGIHQTWWLYFAVTSRRPGGGLRRCWPLLGGADIPIVALNDAPYTFIEAKRVVLLAPGTPVPTPYADFPY